MALTVNILDVRRFITWIEPADRIPCSDWQINVYEQIKGYDVYRNTNLRMPPMTLKSGSRYWTDEWHAYNILMYTFWNDWMIIIEK